MCRFEMGHRVSKPANCQQVQTQQRACGDQIRLDADRGFESLFGSFKLSLLAQRQPQIHMGLGDVGSQADHDLERAHFVFQPVFLTGLEARLDVLDRLGAELLCLLGKR